MSPASAFGATIQTAALLTVLFISAVQGFTASGIFSNPSLVQEQNVELEFYVVPESTVPALGTISLTAPNNISVKSSGLTCYDVLNKRDDCTVIASAKTFIITTQIRLDADLQFQFRIGNAIDNPVSTQPTDSWSILTSAGEGQDFEIILTATEGFMNSFALRTESRVVGASTSVELRWKGAHAVPQGSHFQIKFPIWNPNEPSVNLRKSFLQGSVSCTPQTVLSSKLQCNFQDDTLTISGGVTDDITRSTEIVLTVTGFKNPIDTGMRSGFSVKSLVLADDVYYTIDSGTGTLQVFDYATLSQGKLEVRFPEDPEAGTIQSLDSMKLSWYLPVPLDKGCRITVELPEQYSISTVTEVGSLNVFGPYKEYTVADRTLSVNRALNSFTIRACDKFIDNDNIAVLYINQLKQYKYEKLTDSIKIKIDTQAGQKIARVESGIGFLPTRGEAQVSAVATNSVVQTATSLRFSLKPEHMIYADDVPQIVISFPSDTAVASPSCTVTDVFINENDPPITPECQRQQNTFILKNWLAVDYKPQGDDNPIEFTIGDVYNPLSTKPVVGLQIEVLAQGQYAIDEFEGETPWALTSGTFDNAIVDPVSYVAYSAENTYEISFTPQHAVPINSYIDIIFPPEVILPDPSFSQSSCVAERGFPSSQVICQFFTRADLDETGHYILRILNAYRLQNARAGTPHVLQIPGIQNPIRVTPTQAFTFQTWTQEDYLIDQFEGANIQMLQSAEIEDIQVIPSNYVNSKRASYSFTMIPSVPVTMNTFILMTFPEQLTLPETDAELSCSSTYLNLITSVTCGIDRRETGAIPNTVRVALTLTNSQINEEDRLGFTIEGIVNPSSTQTTDSLQVRIVDSASYASINQKLRGITMTTNEPSAVSKAAIEPESYQPGVPTKYIIDFWPEHAIQSRGGIMIRIPPQIAISSDIEITVEATVTDRATDNAQLFWKVEESARSITIENVIQGDGDFIPGPFKQITLSVSGLSTPFTNQATDSFIVSSFNLVNGIYYYFIDIAAQGLFIKSQCSYPCNTCPLDEPFTCLSCFETQAGSQTGLPFLQLDTCVSECNFGRYFDTDTNQCELCHESCLQCSDSADTCTICGGLEFPYHLDTQCLDECPPGFIGDLAANKCQKCAEPCFTCSNTIATCSSCDPESDYSFFFKEECLLECTPEVSVNMDGECVECDHTCKTCEDRPGKCTSCAQHMKFDPLNFLCTAECLPETQIYNPDLEQCDTCNANCTTCQGDVNKCTACKPGFVLNKDFTCQATCNNDNQTPVSQICETCEEPCYSCNNTVDFCTSCLLEPTKYFLHKKQMCVQYCPAKYNVTEDGLECEWQGLLCPEGFELDRTGDGCVPIVFECAAGYELNEQNSACVPEPGSPVPFPFLIAAVFVSFLVLGSYLKEKFFTKVYTCLLCIIGGFEIVMYGLMVGFAAAAEEWAICGLCSVGLISLLISNIAFTVYYNRDVVKKDDIYQKWLYFFPKTKTMVPIVSICLNFKCSKIIYSGFYGLESSMAKFGRPMEYYRIIRMCSYFSFIFCYGFIFLADIVIFVRVKWGYQLLILGIETMVLQILVIVLTYLESRKPPAELLSVGSTQYTSINPKRRGEVKVKSAFDMDSDDDYEQGIPDVDEDMMIRSKEAQYLSEVKLRSTAFNKIIKQVQLNCHVQDDSSLMECMSKFDAKKLKVRQCFSMNGRLNVVDSDWSAEERSHCDEDFTNISLERESPEEDPLKVEKLRDRRYSWPLLKQVEVDIPIAKFNQQIDHIIQADEEYLIDNCITEVKIVNHKAEKKPPKMVSRRTQTYLRDLLQLDGYEQDNDSELSVIMDDDAEIDSAYAVGIIQNVIENVSGNESNQDFEEQMQEESFEKFEKAKQQEEYDLTDIMGDFEIDDLGNFIIIRAAGSSDLLDKRGRKVNRRGYLVDRFGNVINTKGNVIFKAMELDVDDEIPAPFDYAAKKPAPQLVSQRTQHQPRETISHQQTFQIVNEQAPIEDEVHQNVMFELNQQKTPTVEQLSDEDQEDDGEDYQPPEESKHSQDDVDILIDEITKEKIPKKKKALKQKKIPHAMLDNHPPRRFGPQNSQSLYPMIGVQNEEQKKLASIADQISIETQKLALDNNRHHIMGDMSNSDLVSNQHLQQQPSIIPASSYHDEMMLKRPASSMGDHQTQNLLTRKQQRPHTSVNVNKRLSKYQRDRDLLITSGKRQQLQRVYQNPDQIQGFDDQESRNIGLINSSRVQQPQQDIHKISEIYLNKSISNLPQVTKQGSGNRTTTVGMKPFRPLMHQFEDDPSELNADTIMDGVRYGASQSKDVSIAMAERVDQIQRTYINQSQLQQRAHTIMMMPSTTVQQKSDMDLSEVKQETMQQLTSMKDYQGVVRQDNWIQ